MRTAALAALVASLLIAAPAGAATREQVQAAAFGVPTPAVPMRDVVIDHPTRASARAAASGSLARYPVNDGAGRSIEIINQCVPVVCQATPEEIANFLGTVAHHDEVNLLTVVLTTPAGVASQCGSAEAQACYYPSLDRMVINGDKSPAPDGASWEFVIAHEYGHHLANHRNNAPFDNPAIDWGPKRWGSNAGVCPGVRAGRYFPGNEGAHYFENPGEAFAESFAHNRFPNDPVPWHWTAFPAPDAGAFAAIQGDALDPWNGNSADRRRGRFRKKGPKRGRNKKVKRFATPLDGNLTLTLKGPDRADLALTLKGSDGRTLARSDGVGSGEEVNFTICGERNFTAVVRRQGLKKKRPRFHLTALRP